MWELLGLGDSSDAAAVTASAFSLIAPSRKLKVLPWAKLRIPLIVFQILTQFIGITGSQVPLLYRDFLSGLDVFNIDIGWIFSIGCIAKITFYEGWPLTTIAPTVFTLVLCYTCAVVYWRMHTSSETAVVSAIRNTVATADNTTTTNTISSSNRGERSESALAEHKMTFLGMIFIVYSTVSTVIFVCLDQFCTERCVRMQSKD
jgi:hypothetical protein